MKKEIIVNSHGKAKKIIEAAAVLAVLSDQFEIRVTRKVDPHPVYGTDNVYTVQLSDEAPTE
jgi:hypothetical protein